MSDQEAINPRRSRVVAEKLDRLAYVQTAEVSALLGSEFAQSAVGPGLFLSGFLEQEF
jgi:hypothetical protein